MSIVGETDLADSYESPTVTNSGTGTVPVTGMQPAPEAASARLSQAADIHSLRDDDDH